MEIEHEAVYTVSLRQEAIPEGAYTVAYSVMSVDGHSVSDTYEFGIGEVAEQQDSQSTPSEVAEERDSQQKSEAPRITLSTIVPLLAICGGIVLVTTLVLGTAAFLRRSN